MKWVLAAGLCAAVSACTCGSGGSADRGDGGDDGPLTAETFCEKSATRYCRSVEGCGRMGAGLTDRCVAVETAECKSTARLAASGGVAFDETLARKCIEALDRYPCGLEGLTAPECELPRFFKPAGTLGKPCGPGTCVEGFCPQTGTGCPVCTQFSPVGGGCQLANACDPAKAFCNAQNQCAALLGDGTDCTEARQCASGFCTGGPPKCGAAQVGASCAASTDCPKSAYCRGVKVDAMGTLTQNGTCTAKVSNGAACTADLFSPCLEPDARCLDGTCQTIASFTRSAGQSCADSAHCAQGSYCNSGTCRPLIAQSGTCGTLGCASGLICSVSSHICRPVALENQPCSTMEASCAEQLFCAAGTCKRTPEGRAENQECSADSDCASHRCVLNASGQTVCGASCG